jgi:hypothetical protein
VCWRGPAANYQTKPDATHFYPEDEGSMYLQYVGNTAHIHTVQNPRAESMLAVNSQKAENQQTKIRMEKVKDLYINMFMTSVM